MSGSYTHDKDNNYINHLGYMTPLQFAWSMLQQTGLLWNIPMYTNKRMIKRQKEKPNNKSYKKWKKIDQCILMICNITKLEMGFTRKTSNKKYWADDGSRTSVFGQTLCDIFGPCENTIFLLDFK